MLHHASLMSFHTSHDVLGKILGEGRHDGESSESPTPVWRQKRGTVAGRAPGWCFFFVIAWRYRGREASSSRCKDLFKVARSRHALLAGNDRRNPDPEMRPCAVWLGLRARSRAKLLQQTCYGLLLNADKEIRTAQGIHICSRVYKCMVEAQSWEVQPEPSAELPWFLRQREVQRQQEPAAVNHSRLQRMHVTGQREKLKKHLLAL